MDEAKELLKKSEFSDKAIDFFLKKKSVGQIKNPTVQSFYTGPCGNTIEIYLKIESKTIKDAKFQAVGCAGTFSSGSALMEMIKGKKLDEAEKITAEDIIRYLDGLPEQKVHCSALAIRSLNKAIEKYRKMGKNRAMK